MIQELESLKKEIEDAKIEKARLEGQLKSVQERMRAEYNCRTVEDAQKKLTRMERDWDKLANTIETDFNELQEMYEW